VLEHGRLVMNQDRLFGNTPVIKLGGHFKKVLLHSCVKGMSIDILSYTDSAIPEALQADSEYHRA